MHKIFVTNLPLTSHYQNTTHTHTYIPDMIRNCQDFWKAFTLQYWSNMVQTKDSWSISGGVTRESYMDILMGYTWHKQNSWESYEATFCLTCKSC